MKRITIRVSSAGFVKETGETLERFLDNERASGRQWSVESDTLQRYPSGHDHDRVVVLTRE